MLAAVGLSVRFPLSGLRILIVDDDKDARDAVSSVLEMCGAQTCAVGCAAAARVELAARPFDVLLSDIEMPHEDGYTLIRAVRRSSTPEIAAAAITGRAAPADCVRAIAAGFDRVVGKPLGVEALVDAVCALTGRAPPA